ncbi:hypothetical protein HDU96_001717, partial [Phlyctochytrium bullatum]
MFEALGQQFEIKTSHAEELAILDQLPPPGNGFISVGVSGSGSGENRAIFARIQRYPRQKPHSPRSGPKLLDERQRQRVLEKPEKAEGKGQFLVRLEKRKRNAPLSYDSAPPLSENETHSLDDSEPPLSENETHSEDMKYVYMIAMDYAQAQADSAQKVDAPKVERKVSKVTGSRDVKVITHTEVTVLNQTAKPKNHRVPPNVRPRQPTLEDFEEYFKVNVRPTKPEEDANNNVPQQDAQPLSDTVTSSESEPVEENGEGGAQPENEFTSVFFASEPEETEQEMEFRKIKAVVAVMCLVVAYLRRMMIAYYVTVLCAADYFSDKLAKASFLPARPAIDSAGQVLDVLKSLSGVTIDHIEDLYVDLVNQLIDLPESNDVTSLDTWASFRDFLRWMRLVISKEDVELQLSDSKDFCIQRRKFLDVIRD